MRYVVLLTGRCLPERCFVVIKLKDDGARRKMKHIVKKRETKEIFKH